MTDSRPAVLWFRQDLRLDDNPALQAAVARGAPVVPLYVLDDETAGAWRPGGASRWWLHHSLTALSKDLSARGAPLVLRRGPAEKAVQEVAAETEAAAVFWNRCYEPYAVARDTALKTALTSGGLEVKSFNGALLQEPWSVTTKAGEPFKVFTPFWNALLAHPAPARPSPAPRTIPGAKAAGDRLESWGLLPTRPDWAGGLRAAWQPGESGAKACLADFLDGALESYKDGRDRPDLPATSRLSPHLHWGELGPRQVWHATLDRSGTLDGPALAYLRQLGWRDFSTHLLYTWPDFPERSWKRSFDAFPWRDDAAAFEAWCRGRTGYPIVDAGMRELWDTGWMHNRVRMITASFLVKDLMIPWQKGEAWFWDTLVDADLANNAASWQWVAGCGADAAPYFRIFNPVRQGEKFDPKGAYVRRWVPELADLPDDLLHKPWEAPDGILRAAGVEPGVTYPEPIVDHGAARRRALAAYEQVKRAAG